MTYATFGYTHNIVAPDTVIADIIARQVRKFGRSFVDRNALVTVGSVQTINARASKMQQWAARVALWVVDEAHHLLPGNLWGKCIALFPHARGVGFTATPRRTDRKSLAASQGGVFDDMVKGVTARQLIDEGHICDYRIIAPPSSIDRSAIRTGKSGDFTQKGLSDAKRESTITGDCVESYLKYAGGTQAVVFAVDIEHSQDLVKAYRDAGVSAETVSSKTVSSMRKAIMSKFEAGTFKVLVNVDLFGEGLNVEGIETVIMARPTQSFVLYVQQFFRALTKADDKHLGTIIDHAGNVGHFGKLFGLPDTYNAWTLESELRASRGRREDDGIIPVKTCTECFTAYEATAVACPACGHKPEPVSRGKPEHVDGDLVELDPATLRQMRGEADRIMGDPQMPTGLSDIAQRGLINRWQDRKEAQEQLRHAMATWAGVRRDAGEDLSESWRRFYHTFGVDVMTAQGLGASEADKLRERIERSWQ